MKNKKVKPRSKASFGPPDFARITGRIKRLKDCIAKHAASPREHSAQKIAECQAEIERCKTNLVELQAKIDEALAE